MSNKITKQFLQEHFRKHDSTPTSQMAPRHLVKHHNLIVNGGHHSFMFRDFTMN